MLERILLGAAAGLAPGAVANLSADLLPQRGAGEAKAASAPLHYLTIPWYFFRGGACPHCGERRFLRAPLLELAVMAAFALIAWQSDGNLLRAALFCLYAWFLLTALVIDLEHRLVLNVMTGPAAVFALGASLLSGAPTPVEALIGGAVGFGVFFLIALIGHGAMGINDVKLANVIADIVVKKT